MFALGTETRPIQRGVYLDDHQGKWKDGAITWKYNNVNRPASVTDEQVVSAFKRAFSWWSNVCNIKVSYGGLSNTDIDSTTANEVTVGFLNTNSGGADAVSYSNDAASNYTFYTGGHVRIDSNPEVSKNTVMDSYVLPHEVGHVLGLAHSDDPASIMYANPYTVLNNGGGNISVYGSETPGPLYGDDMEACGNLYGSKGFFKVVDNSQLVPDNSLGLSSEASLTTPTYPPMPSTVTQLNTSINTYFALRWTNQNPSSIMTLRMVMPNGLVYGGFSAAATSSAGYNYYTVTPNLLPLAGKWQFQGLVDGKLGTAQYFTVPTGKVSEPPKLEYAAIVEQSAGSITQRLVNYSAVATSYVNAYLNDNYSAVGKAISPALGQNHLDYWAKSVLSRYPLNLANNQGGQPANSADALKQVTFSLNNGSLSGSGIDIVELGTQVAYSARANIQSSVNGAQGIYVAALAGGRFIFRHDSGWDTTPAPLLTFNGPAAINFDILRGIDTRLLPAGTALFVGYGSTLDAVVQRNQYKLIRVF